MSATAQTGNYHLPIYEAGNLANYMVDWNGAMNTIDAAMNVNHTDADKLKTDFEAIETEFQQVKTESSGAATAASQAQTDAARAITIANNATTVAGDAQVDAHSVLTAYTSTFKPITRYGIKTFLTPNAGYYTGRWEMEFSELYTYNEIDLKITQSGLEQLQKIALTMPGIATSFYIANNPVNLNADLSKYNFWTHDIEPLANGQYFIRRTYKMDAQTTFTEVNDNPILVAGIYVNKTANNTEAYHCIGLPHDIVNTSGAFILAVGFISHTPYGVQPKFATSNDIVSFKELDADLKDQYPDFY